MSHELDVIGSFLFGVFIGACAFTFFVVAASSQAGAPPTVYTGVVEGAVYSSSDQAVYVQIGTHTLRCSLTHVSVQEAYELPYNMTSLPVGSNATVIQDHAGNCVRG